MYELEIDSLRPLCCVMAAPKTSVAGVPVGGRWPKRRRRHSRGRWLHRRPCRSLATFVAIAALGLSLFCTPIVQAAEEESVPRDDEATGAVVPSRKAIFETPYLCRLGKRYPWIRTFVDERLSLFTKHVEWRETGGNPRLIVFGEGNVIKTLFHFEDGHKNIEEIFMEKLEL